MARSDRNEDRAALLDFAREIAHCGIARIEQAAREVLEYVGEEES